jgi:hypothetical protein
VLRSTPLSLHSTPGAEAVPLLNWREDMSEFVRQVQPERWKVFQVLPVGGQNDGAVDDLLSDATQFRAFVDRHASLSKNLAPIAEDNDAMTASYAMVDPLGRLFDNSAGHHTYSAPIHEVGVARALRQIRFLLHPPGRPWGEFGGDLRKLARDLADFHDLELFGSTGQTGQGELRRMSAALRAGALQQVCLVIRWAGHGEIDAIRRLCRTLGITCHSFRSFGAVRRWLKGDSAFQPPAAVIDTPRSARSR